MFFRLACVMIERVCVYRTVCESVSKLRFSESILEQKLPRKKNDLARSSAVFNHQYVVGCFFFVLFSRWRHPIEQTSFALLFLLYGLFFLVQLCLKQKRIEWWICWISVCHTRKLMRNVYVLIWMTQSPRQFHFLLIDFFFLISFTDTNKLSLIYTYVKQPSEH